MNSASTKEEEVASANQRKNLMSNRLRTAAATTTAVDEGIRQRQQQQLSIRMKKLLLLLSVSTFIAAMSSIVSISEATVAASAPIQQQPQTASAETTGIRLCGVKLTMTLNAICKNQICGGYFYEQPKKKRVYPMTYLDWNNAMDAAELVDSTSDDDAADDEDGEIVVAGGNNINRRSSMNVEVLPASFSEDDVVLGNSYPFFHVWTRQPPVHLERQQANDNNDDRRLLAKRAIIGGGGGIKRSGIATECCMKRCTIAYLKTYCCAKFSVPPPGPLARANKNHYDRVLPSSLSPQQATGPFQPASPSSSSASSSPLLAGVEGAEPMKAIII